MISLAPITMKGANVVVSAWHSHHKPVRGCVFCIELVARVRWEIASR